MILALRRVATVGALIVAIATPTALVAETDYVNQCIRADTGTSPERKIKLCTRALSQLARNIKEDAENKGIYYDATAFAYVSRAYAHADEDVLDITKIETDCRKANQIAKLRKDAQLRRLVSNCFKVLDTAKELAEARGS